MVLLICAKCGSHNVSLGKYKNVYYCDNCLEDLELWEVRFVQVSEIPSENYDYSDNQKTKMDTT